MVLEFPFLHVFVTGQGNAVTWGRPLPFRRINSSTWSTAARLQPTR